MELWGAVTVAQGEADTAGASLAFQVMEALKHGPDKPGHLAEMLDATEETVKKTLQRLEKRDIVMRLHRETPGGRGNPQSWSLVTNRDRNRDETGTSREPGDDDDPTP